MDMCIGIKKSKNVQRTINLNVDKMPPFGIKINIL